MPYKNWFVFVRSTVYESLMNDVNYYDVHMTFESTLVVIEWGLFSTHIRGLGTVVQVVQVVLTIGEDRVGVGSPSVVFLFMWDTIQRTMLHFPLTYFTFRLSVILEPLTKEILPTGNYCPSHTQHFSILTFVLRVLYHIGSSTYSIWWHYSFLLFFCFFFE